MSAKMNIPELRFGEFSGEWEKSSLKDNLKGLIDCEHKTAPYLEHSEYLVVRTNNVKDGRLLYDDIKYTTKEGFSEWTKREIPSYGDILFTREAPAGESCLIPKDKMICLGQRMVLLRPNLQKLSASFLLWFLQSSRGKKNIKDFVIGTTVTRINIKDIYRINCHKPDLLEQEKIASFLSSVDAKIEQLSKKKKLLEEYKKGAMQKIFSLEIRFKDDNGSEYPEWIEKKIKNILKIRSGKDYKHLEKGDTPVYGTGGYMTSVNNYLYDGKSVCIGRKGTINKPMFISGKFWTVDTLFYTYQFENISPEYFYYLSLSINWLKYNEGTTLPSLSKKTIESIKIKIPKSSKEQIKIANFLSSIDAKIELITKELDATKEFKKALLQKMFV